MTKDEAKHKLRKEGYNVVDDNSVVTVLIPVDASVPKTVKEIEDKLKTYGYEASFAVKQVSDAAASQGADVNDDSEDEVYEEESVPASAEEETAEEASIEEEPSKQTDEADDKEDDNGGNIEYFDEDDSDMLLTEDAVQFSLDDFGLDY
ncbi:MAG: hypothetical protein K5868_06120 [Lachnospiraceae bacterium]|nr:hypothetical protein [Lachnospiraceae bacterium]